MKRLHLKDAIDVQLYEALIDAFSKLAQHVWLTEDRMKTVIRVLDEALENQRMVGYVPNYTMFGSDVRFQWGLTRANDAARQLRSTVDAYREMNVQNLMHKSQLGRGLIKKSRQLKETRGALRNIYNAERQAQQSNRPTSGTSIP